MQAVVFVCSLFGLAAKDFVLVSSVEFDPKDLTYGKKLEGHCFQRIVKVSAKTCWERCNSHPKCVSFNYIRNFKLCELNSGTGTNANFSPTTGHYYGVVAKATPETCDENRCEEDKTCDGRTNLCTNTECPVIPETVGVTRRGNLNNIGAKVILDCDAGFLTKYSVQKLLPLTSECLANETHAYWSVTPFTCVPVTCKSVADLGHDRTTGQYRYFDSVSEKLVHIFCDFDRGNGYGYTYFHPSTLGQLNNFEDHYWVKDHVIARHYNKTGVEKETILKQLAIHQDSYNLSVMLSRHDGFNNTEFNQEPFLYVGFLPNSFTMQNSSEQGYAADGQEATFWNCDLRLANRMVVSDNAMINYSTVCYSHFADVDFNFLNFANITEPDSRKLGLAHFFKTFEIAFGGCGTYLTTKCSQLSTKIEGVTFGLPFVLG